MGRFFSESNPFFSFMGLVFDLVMMNLIWLVCCIPVISFGASTTALYTVMLRRAKNEEGYMVRGFFSAFKSNFKQTVPLTLIYILAAAVLVSDMIIIRNWEGTFGSFMFGFCMVAIMVAQGVFSYVWPLQAKFENTVKGTLANAGRIAIVKLPRTAILVVLHVVPWIIFLFVPTVFVALTMFWILGVGSVTAFVSSKLINPIFDELMNSGEE